jgi:hypothetical protein
MHSDFGAAYNHHPDRDYRSNFFQKKIISGFEDKLIN